MNRLTPAVLIVMMCPAVCMGDAESSPSAIDRPDFKIRNQPFVLDEPQVRDLSSESTLDVEPSAVSNIPQPSPEEIYSIVPDDLIIRYMDRVDIEKRMTASQFAEKYLGAASGESESSNAMRWMMMTDQEQRSVKLAWFKNARSSIPMEEFNRIVDIRTYRVLVALRSTATPGLRKVEVPVVTATYIEKLTMPGIKPLTDVTLPVEGVPSPALRPILAPPEPRIIDPLEPASIPYSGTGRAWPDMGGQPEKPAGEPGSTEPAPTHYGIPSSLRNAP